jgi:hypothetical protein
VAEGYSRQVLVGFLLGDVEALDDYVLESCLYVLRAKLRAE